MMRSKIKLKRLTDPLFISYKEKIKQFGHILATPNLDNVNTIYDKKSSWYTNEIQYFNTNDVNNYVPNFDLSNSVHQDIKLKTIRIRCYPNQSQIPILNFLFEADKILYNHTISFLRKNIPYILIHKYKSVYGKNKYFYVCDKKIKELTLGLNKLINNKNKSIETLNKKLNITEKTKSVFKYIINKKEQITSLNKGITKINIKITEYQKQKDSCKHCVEIYDHLDKQITEFTNYKNLRSNNLKTIRDEIFNKYKIYNIPAHSLDASIKRACTSYKSGITNLLDGNIKRFRVRCLNTGNNKGIIEMEKQTFNKDGNNFQICKKVLGSMKYEYNNKDFKITVPSTSSFYLKDNKYWLLYTAPVEITNNAPKMPYISLDSGIRTFQTGYTNNSIMNFGTDIYNTVKLYLNKIDKLNSDQTIDNEIYNCQEIINKHQNIIDILSYKHQHPITIKHINKLNKLILFNKNRIEKLNKIKDIPKKCLEYEKYLNKRKKSKANFYYDVIKRKVDDLHWKLAHYLASNYDTIIIGKFSMKSVCEQDKVVDMVKRVGTIMRHYEFRSKLVYKCLSLGTKILVSSEKYTTKMCSMCGHYNEHVKGEKKIHCEGCNKVYPRDAYSARGILINNLSEK